MSQTETIVVGACTVVLHHPELTDTTRAKREAELHKALTRYAVHLEEQKRRREGAN